MVETPPELIRRHIRSIPDFPKKGIMFRDITPLLQNPDVFRAAIDVFAERYQDRPVDTIVSIESRGFILGSALAYRMGAGFTPVRKPHKLPSATIRESYTLEYGEDTLEIHKDGIRPGQNILIVDDLLATGGTAAAAIRLVERLGGHVEELAFLIELSFLGGRTPLKPHGVFSVIDYPNER